MCVVKLRGGLFDLMILGRGGVCFSGIERSVVSFVMVFGFLLGLG